MSRAARQVSQGCRSLSSYRWTFRAGVWGYEREYMDVCVSTVKGLKECENVRVPLLHVSVSPRLLGNIRTPNTPLLSVRRRIEERKGGGEGEEVEERAWSR